MLHPPPLTIRLKPSWVINTKLESSISVESKNSVARSVDRSRPHSVRRGQSELLPAIDRMTKFSQASSDSTRRYYNYKLTDLIKYKLGNEFVLIWWWQILTHALTQSFIHRFDYYPHSRSDLYFSSIHSHHLNNTCRFQFYYPRRCLNTGSPTTCT